MADVDTFEMETNDKPTASIIWLHGLGSSGYDFEPIVPELNLPTSLGIRFIFPHAPKRVVTINGGLRMPAWYDIYSHDIDRKVDTKQLIASAINVAKLIDREIDHGIASERIIIAGFSQGGAVGYQIALNHRQKLGGLIALSTYFATKEIIEYSTINNKLPIFIGHGTNDDIVSDTLGEQARDILKEKQYKVEYHAYPMGHSVCMEEVGHISQWIKTRLL